MWHLPNESENRAFYATLRDDHRIATKVVLLNTAFNEVDGGTLYASDKADDPNDISNLISDGSIDVDTTRGTRRTAELTILNPTAEFTPSLEDFKPDGAWVGLIYLNRVVRIYRGVYVGGKPLYAPVGTFLIDVTDVEAQSNMSQVVLTMSDMWKKLTKSKVTRPILYPHGTQYNAIISDFLNFSGADQPLAPNLDPLASRDSDNKVTQHAVHLAQGDSRGDKLKELADMWDIDMYFDPLGRFVSQDRLDPKDKAIVWRYYSDPDRTGMLVTVKRTFTDDNLYNHVVVVGTGNPKETVRIEKKDNDPRSKTSIDLIGDRTFIIESDKIKNLKHAKKALNRAWKMRFQIGETIDLETICNPALEGDDVIKVTDRDLSKVDQTYRAQQFTIPLVTSRQTIRGVNIIREDDVT